MTNAMVGLADGRKIKREQEIITPQFIVDAVHELWPQGIALDPAGSELSIVGADRQLLLTRGQDGLKETWPERTYINPPYKDLKKWLKRGETQQMEQLWLVPNRTGRRWFRDWRNELVAYVELDPFAFHGFEGKAPFAMIAGYLGWYPTLFEVHFGPLGQIWRKTGADEWVSQSRPNHLTP